MTFSTFAFHNLRRPNWFIKTIGLNFATVDRSLLMPPMNDAMRIPSTPVCYEMRLDWVVLLYQVTRNKVPGHCRYGAIIMTIPPCITVYFILRAVFGRWFTLNRCYLNRLVTCFSVCQQDPNTKLNLNSHWHLY